MKFICFQSSELRDKLARFRRKLGSLIERVNALRNALAHSFFPENRRQYAGHRKVIYLGEDVFTLRGLLVFEDDSQRAID